MCITSLASLVITEVVKESDIKNHITPSIEVPKEDDLTVCVWSTVYRHIPTAWIIYGFFACKYDFLFQVFANFLECSCFSDFRIFLFEKVRGSEMSWTFEQEGL